MSLLTTLRAEATRRGLLDEGARQAERMGWREPVTAATLHRLHLALIRQDGDETARCRAWLANAGDTMATPLFRDVLASLSS